MSLYGNQNLLFKCEGAGNDLENKNQDYANSYSFNVDRLYYDGSGAGRKNCAGLCLTVPYSEYW